MVESISYGKPYHYKKLTFQAFSAAITNPEQVRFVLNYLGNVNNTMHARFPTAKNKIVAYRVNQVPADLVKVQAGEQGKRKCVTNGSSG